jgi:hypothetical protein
LFLLGFHSRMVAPSRSKKMFNCDQCNQEPPNVRCDIWSILISPQTHFR